MTADPTEIEMYEFECWRAFQDRWITCDVCGERIRWTSSWAWVRDTAGDHVRACFDCLGKSVLLLPIHVATPSGVGCDG